MSDLHPDTPWLTDANALDVEYFYNYSGDKTPSNIVMRFADQNNGAIGETQMLSLVAVLWARFNTKWSKLYETMSATYNPIENYSMTEETTTAQDILTSQTGNSDGSIFGFNSNIAAPSAKSEAGNETHTTAEADKNIITHTRSGNIGVTTSQQMQQSSIDLWNGWNLFEQIFTDVDKVLTLPIYNY